MTGELRRLVMLMLALDCGTEMPKGCRQGMSGSETVSTEVLPGQGVALVFFKYRLLYLRLSRGSTWF